MLPPVEAIECFVAAARHLNFRAAAGAVSLTPAALGKRIQQLERLLGVQLFHRTTRRVTLTEAGLALQPHAERMLEVAGECTRAARGEVGPAPVRLTVGTRHELGLSWLLPQLRPLAEALPHVTIDLYVSSGPDLERRVRSGEIDCAISSRRISDPRLDGLRLHREDYAFVASPSLLKKRPLASPEDAGRHVLVDLHPELPLYGYWAQSADAPELSFGGLRSMGTIAAARELLRWGEGVGVLPHYLVAPDLEAGDLTRVFPEVEAVHDWFRLIVRGDDPRRSIYDALAAELREVPLR